MIIMPTLSIINVFFIKKTHGINNAAAVERNDGGKKACTRHKRRSLIGYLIGDIKRNWLKTIIELTGSEWTEQQIDRQREEQWNISCTLWAITKRMTHGH